MNRYRLQDICDYLEAFAPTMLAAEWDNVGLLAGDPAASVQRVMTCLTITPRSAEEAVRREADLVVTHHPLPFHAIKRLITTNVPGRLLWELITHHVAIYSPHTAFDATTAGINQRLAEGLDLVDIAPLVPHASGPEGTGAGRAGRLRQLASLGQVAERLKQFLSLRHLQFVGDLNDPIQSIAVACGAAGEFLAAAVQARCDLLVVGETNLHTCLEAEARRVALLLPGHFASEHFAVEQLSGLLAAEFPGLDTWSSATESDPLRWF